MTYKTANFNLNTQAIAGRKQWTYEDTGTGDTGSTGFSKGGFFADAGNKGASVDDLVTITDSTNNHIYFTHLTVVQDTGATQGTVAAVAGDTA